MKKVLWLVLLVIAWPSLSKGLADSIKVRPLRNVNLSILGDASWFTLSFERLYEVSPNALVGAKLGVGYNEEFLICIASPCREPHKYLTVPHHVTVNFGSTRHFFEVGVGGTLLFGNTSQPYLPYAILGYRFLPMRAGKSNFRVFAELPFSGWEHPDILFIPFGVSLGLSF